MSDTSILALLGFVTALIAVIAPVMKLNTNIVRLNTNFEHMMKNDDVRDKRIENHGKEIDKIIEKQRTNEKILDLHEIRIGRLEEKK